MSSAPENTTPTTADHAAADRVRTAYWVERLRRLGPAESFRVADDLRRHVKTLRPHWPSREERDADLAAHVALQEALGRVRPGGG